MHYWNKDNFAGLLELAKEFAKTPELAGLAEYCLMREKGLRSQALARLNHFLAETKLWDVDIARRQVITILEANACTPAAHHFMTFPLMGQLIFPTLDRWLVDEPSAICPIRWLGLLRSDPDALNLALSLDPGDIPVRRCLINLALDKADYSTHHLSESVLLSSVEETRSAIAVARNLIISAPDMMPFSVLLAEADEYEEMLDDWLDYNNSPIGGFPQWCEARKRTYRWSTIVYYDKLGTDLTQKGSDT